MARKKLPAKKVGRRHSLPKDYVSHTQADTYIQCPARYKAKYIDGVIPETSYPMRCGLVVHTALKQLNDQSDREQQDLGVEDSEAALEAAIKAETKPGEIKARDVKLMAECLRLSALTINKTRNTYIGSESEFPIDYPPTKLLVIIDRIDTFGPDGVEITDYKWSERVLSKQDLEKDNQLNIYAYAYLKDNPGIRRLLLTQYMVRYDQPNSIEIDPDQVQYIKAHLDYVIEGIQSGDFDPRLHHYCHNCPIRAKCKAYKDRYVNNKETVKDMDAAHAEYRRLKAQASIVNAREGEVKNFIRGEVANAQGPIQVEGGLTQWGYLQVKGKEKNMGKLCKLYLKYGLDITPLVGITSENLTSADKQLYNRLPQSRIKEFQAEREKLIKTKITTQLRPTKV